MIYRLILSLMIASTLLSAFVSAAPDEATQSEVSVEEYAVYSALITEQYVWEKTKLVVIADPTSGVRLSGDSADFALEQLAPLSQATLDHFNSANDRPYSLSKSFPLEPEYKIVEYSEIKKLFDSPDLDEAWKEFYRRFPDSNGYIVLSRVGFNPDKDQALVSMGWMRDTLWGEGKLIFLTKREGKWKVEKDYLMWAA